jgi:hypothetical protein
MTDMTAINIHEYSYGIVFVRNLLIPFTCLCLSPIISLTLVLAHIQLKHRGKAYRERECNLIIFGLSENPAMLSRVSVANTDSKGKIMNSIC